MFVLNFKFDELMDKIQKKDVQRENDVARQTVRKPSVEIAVKDDFQLFEEQQQQKTYDEHLSSLEVREEHLQANSGHGQQQHKYNSDEEEQFHYQVDEHGFLLDEEGCYLED